MQSLLSNTLFLIMFPSFTVLAGSVIGFVRTPGRKATSIIQHFTAGLVLAAVAIELLPQLTKAGNRQALILGYACGLGLMLGVKWWAKRLEVNKGYNGLTSKSLVAATGIDLFVDGLLVGTSSAIGPREATIITIALTIEAFFLSLSATSTLGKNRIGRNKEILISGSFALLLLAGIILGRIGTTFLSGSLLVVLLAFASAALLYLVVEELLFEAHREFDTPLATLLFFIGFLLILLMEA